jgi:hypothetical protein
MLVVKLFLISNWEKPQKLHRFFGKNSSLVQRKSACLNELFYCNAKKNRCHEGDDVGKKCKCGMRWAHVFHAHRGCFGENAFVFVQNTTPKCVRNAKAPKKSFVLLACP